MKVLGVLALILGAALGSTSTGTLDGYQVLSVTAVTPSQFQFLKALQVDNVELDFWTAPKYQGVTDIMVSPELKGDLTSLLAGKGIKWSLKIRDVARLVAEQKATNDANKKRAGKEMTWDAYHRYDDIIEWLRSIETNPLVTLTIAGQSFEGRDIHQVKLSSGPGSDPEVFKPAIFIDANLHAREWVTVAATTWIINEIITKPTEFTALLDKYDIFLIPLANPDGYEYSHLGNNRMWRKTRKLNPGSTCYGCDPNRNFGYFFGGESTSPNPCSDLYKGQEAFSEPETQTIRDAIKTLQAERNVHAYFTIHSYSQLWLLSWGYTQGVYPEDYTELLAWGTASVAAIFGVHDKVYETGQGADLLYGVGGASDDWAKSEGVKYVTTLEARDTGDYGFILPPDQIIPTAQEILAGIVVIARPEYDPVPEPAPEP